MATPERDNAPAANRLRGRSAVRRVSSPGGVVAHDASPIYDPLDADLLRQIGAVHEAGHVVASLRAGLGVDGVYLSPSPQGHMFHAVHTGRITRWDGYMAMLAAGERAADRWLRETGQWTPERAWSVERGAHSDRARAIEFAESTDRTFDFLAHPWDGWTLVCSYADGGLDAHWNHVMAVANALLKEGSLDAAAVARVTGLTNPSADSQLAS